MEEQALPLEWMDDILEKTKKLKMRNTKDVKQFGARAKGLQILIKNLTDRMDDMDLAECVVSGLPKELSAEIKKWRLLKVMPFDFNAFQATAEL